LPRPVNQILKELRVLAKGDNPKKRINPDPFVGKANGHPLHCPKSSKPFVPHVSIKRGGKKKPPRDAFLTPGCVFVLMASSNPEVEPFAKKAG